MEEREGHWHAGEVHLIPGVAADPFRPGRDAFVKVSHFEIKSCRQTHRFGQTGGMTRVTNRQDDLIFVRELKEAGIAVPHRLFLIAGEANDPVAVYEKTVQVYLGCP